ncbi:glycosyltransferase family 2 protein [Bacteroides fragilis]
MNNPLVSIVIPTYNREQYIEDAIKSAINQTYRNIEIIIVDNCSTDSTWDILNRWAERDERIKVFRNKMNIGPVLNWNECFEHTSGDFIKILWSDDWMAIDFIEKQWLYLMQQ